MKKKILIIAMLLVTVVITQAQTLRELFDKYAEDERFEYVTIGKGMLNFTSALGDLEKDNKNIVGKLTGLKILTLKENAESKLMIMFENDLKKVIDKGNFETALTAREKGKRVNIYYQVDKNQSDMLIVAKEKNELSLIWFIGKMTKEEMMKTFSSTTGTIDNLAKY